MVPRWLAIATVVEAAGLVLLGLGLALQLDLLFQVGGAFAGILLGPVVAVGLGYALRRADATSS